MCRARLIWIVLVVGLGLFPARLAWADSPAEPANGIAEARAECHDRFLGGAYPIEACISFHAALLHWMDSLAGLAGPGLTSGKTQRAHRHEFGAVLGAPTEEDLDQLRHFVAVRRGFVAKHGQSRVDGLTAAFFGTSTLTQALGEVDRVLEEGAGRKFREAVEHYGRRYGKVWDEGRTVRGFMERVRHDPQRGRLGRFLAEVERFFDGAQRTRPFPRLVLTPVSNGSGTHAQAIGRYLLVEIRPGETLRDEVSPIVHENCHFMFYGLSAATRDSLRRHAAQSCASCGEGWGHLLEALPTAIGQGVAGRRFGPDDWSPKQRWYHRNDVDGFAKRIFPLVEQALDGETTLDDVLVRRLMERYDPVSPRSP